MTITTTTAGRYGYCRTMFDLGEQFAADVDLKSALGDLAAVRSLVAEYRARRIELTGAGR